MTCSLLHLTSTTPDCPHACPMRIRIKPHQGQAEHGGSPSRVVSSRHNMTMDPSYDLHNFCTASPSKLHWLHVMAIPSTNRMVLVCAQPLWRQLSQNVKNKRRGNDFRQRVVDGVQDWMIKHIQICFLVKDRERHNH